MCCFIVYCYAILYEIAEEYGYGIVENFNDMQICSKNYHFKFKDIVHARKLIKSAAHESYKIKNYTCLLAQPIAPRARLVFYASCDISLISNMFDTRAKVA